MQEFYTNTLESKFIKSLLSKTYIPTVQVWKPGIKLVKGFTYITKNYILKALVDFTPTSGNIGPKVELDNNYFEVLDTYVFGKFYKGITSNFESNNSLYDTETHYYLGEYLRAYRDLFDINLMPYYNCWGGQYSDKVRLNKVGSDIKLNKFNQRYNDGLKTLLVPIKFNQKYTIYIDSNSPVRFYIAYSEGDRIIEEFNNPTIINELKNKNKNYIKFEEAGLNFSNPKLFEVNIKSTQGTGESEASFYKDYLTLVIQLPEINITNVLVLEGDYLNNKVITKNIYNDDNEIIESYNNRIKEVIYNEKDLKEATKKDLEYYYSGGIPKLTQTFNGKSYAFSDRLIEYLTLNVITENEDISDNIERIQEYIQTSTNRRVNNSMYAGRAFIKGVWDNNLRKYIYDEVTKRNYKNNRVNGTIFDINGFLDKDSESIIMRGDM